jgi:hypothetical protein
MSLETAAPTEISLSKLAYTMRPRCRPEGYQAEWQGNPFDRSTVSDDRKTMTDLYKEADTNSKEVHERRVFDGQ